MLTPFASENVNYMVITNCKHLVNIYKEHYVGGMVFRPPCRALSNHNKYVLRTEEKTRGERGLSFIKYILFLMDYHRALSDMNRKRDCLLLLCYPRSFTAFHLTNYMSHIILKTAVVARSINFSSQETDLQNVRLNEI